MRTMYDAVTAANIPADAPMVAGYCDTIKIPQWTDADWARFPNAVKVRIAKKPTTNDGHVLDVEIGNATPAESPGWVALRRSAGADPSIYCNASTWPSVQQAFQRAGVAEPHYWIARYDGDPAIPAGAVAKQWKTTAGWDLSSVADHWPGVDPASTEEDDMIIVPAANDDHVNLVVKGKTQLYLACSWNRQVKVSALLFYGDTGPVMTGTPVGGARENLTFLPNRPGPIAIPPGAAMATMRYSADHSFTIGFA